MSAAMTSARPYLLRAIYEWIIDNGMTPHITIDAEMKGVEVPRDYVQNGQIVLNIAPSAVQGLVMDNDWVNFSARFGGRPMNVFVPVGAVLGITARENNQGLMFPPEPEPEEAAGHADNPPPEPAAPPKRGRPSLKVVK